MAKELRFREIIDAIIGEINEAKRCSGTIHAAGNIKASGDEVENLIRNKISLFLPERYLVKQGHIVNSAGKVSNQFDIIIFDRLNTPKFFESRNDTVFYPIESVLAVGEIKKTLRKNDLIDFSKKIKYLKVDMDRKLIRNTVYNGQLNNESTLADIVSMGTNRKFKNSLYSFMFAIDGDQMDSMQVVDSNMPNDVYVLNYGYLLYGDFKDNAIDLKVEDEDPVMNTWLEIKKTGVNCLAMMFKRLIDHLNGSQIDPFSISEYMTDNLDFGIQKKDITIYKTGKK